MPTKKQIKQTFERAIRAFPYDLWRNGDDDGSDLPDESEFSDILPDIDYREYYRFHAGKVLNIDFYADGWIQVLAESGDDTYAITAYFTLSVDCEAAIQPKTYHHYSGSYDIDGNYWEMDLYAE